MKLDTESKIKGDLGGTAALKFTSGDDFNSYCAEHIDNYNPDRLEAFAIRIFHGKETAVTLYAIDKERMEGNNYDTSKMPVKKFKLDISFLKNVMQHISEFNMTLSTGDYPLEDMKVMNA